MELKEIVKMVKESGEADLVNVDSNTILECATRIYISGNINQERRGVPPRQDRDFDNKPTQKQLNFLKNRGYDIPIGMSFQEAKRVIGELIDQDKAKNNKKGTETLEEDIYWKEDTMAETTNYDEWDDEYDIDDEEIEEDEDDE